MRTAAVVCVVAGAATLCPPASRSKLVATSPATVVGTAAAAATGAFAIADARLIAAAGAGAAMGVAKGVPVNLEWMFNPWLAAFSSPSINDGNFVSISTAAPPARTPAAPVAKDELATDFTAGGLGLGAGGPAWTTTAVEAGGGAGFAVDGLGFGAGGPDLDTAVVGAGGGADLTAGALGLVAGAGPPDLTNTRVAGAGGAGDGGAAAISVATMGVPATGVVAGLGAGADFAA